MTNQFQRLGQAALMLLVVGVQSAQAQTYTENVLYSFAGTPDGADSEAGLVRDSAGNLYGTTVAGGVYNGGTVFELSPLAGGTWTETILHSFGNGTDGANPQAGLIFDTSGNLYGTTSVGGINSCGDYSCGMVFELSPTTGGDWVETILYNFGGNSEDGYYPYFASLVFDATGNLYGTTGQGGAYGFGTVFELEQKKSGQWTERILHNFGASGRDGGGLSGTLIFDAAGNLYGVTVMGGLIGAGTVFELSTANGKSWTEKILHYFPQDKTDGYSPYGGLIFDAAGNLYGTTWSGYAHSHLGTVFELTPKTGGGWTERILHRFDEKSGTDGSHPYANLVFDAVGNLYGTTFEGGVDNSSSNGGTVFELSPLAGGTWTETILHSFGNGTDGTSPHAGMIFDTSGNLYGTTEYGPSQGVGTYGDGIVFELTP